MDTHLYKMFCDQSKTGRFTFFEPSKGKHLDYAHYLYDGYLRAGNNTPALMVMNPVSAFRFVHELSDEMKDRVVLFDLNDGTSLTPINFLSSNIGSLINRQDYLIKAIKAEHKGQDFALPYSSMDIKQEEALSCAIAAICHLNDKNKVDNLVGPSLLPFLLKMNVDISENFAKNFMTESDERAIFMYYKETVRSLSTGEHRNISKLVDDTINCFGNQNISSLISSPYQAFSPREAVDDGKIVVIIPDYSKLFDRIFCQWMICAYCDHLRAGEDPFLFVCEGFEYFNEINWAQFMAPREQIRTAIAIYDLKVFEANDNVNFIIGDNNLVTVLFQPELINADWIRKHIGVNNRRVGMDVETFFHEWGFNEISEPGVYVQDWEILPEEKRIQYENIPGFARTLLKSSKPVNAASLESRFLISQKAVIDLSGKPPMEKKARNIFNSIFLDK